MKRNFDNLEIGKYYVSDEYPNNAIEIIKADGRGDGYFIASNGSIYYPDGIGWSTTYNLTTEVTVTVTPVVPTKPREFWVVYHGDKAVYAGESKEEVEKKMSENISMWGMDAILPIVCMREVMEGDE